MQVDDGIVGVEHAVGKPVTAQILPDVLDRVEFGRTRREEDRRDIVRYAELESEFGATGISAAFL